MRSTRGTSRGRAARPVGTAFASLFALAAIAAISATPPALAATGRGATLTSASPAASWTGHIYKSRTTFAGPICPSSQADPQDLVCDHFEPTVGVPAGYWSGRRGGLLVSIVWTHASDDFDLYVYDALGRLVSTCGTGRSACASTARSGRSEQVLVPNATGLYEVRVSPISDHDSGYTGSASLVTVHSPSPSPSPGSGGPADGDSFTPGTDLSNWYWAEQSDSVAPLPPSGLSQPLRLPSPQASDTLPVAATGGKPDKISVLQLDLASRGLSGPGRISKLELTIAEGVPGGKNETDDETHPDAQPDFGVADAQGHPHGVRACRVTDSWTPYLDATTGMPGADAWSSLPAYDDTACVDGVRQASDPTAPTWTFDVTSLASAWAADPTANHGVALVPVTSGGSSPADQTWQVNFKLPLTDDPTTPNDEYTETRFKTVIDLADSLAPGVSPPPPAGGSTGGSTGTGSAGFASGSAASVPPAANVAPPQTSTAGSGSAAAAASATPTSMPTIPHIPWYVYVLMPFALAAIVAVRGAVFEAVGGTRPDGVIAAIRRRNALRGGVPSATPIPPWATGLDSSPAAMLSRARARARSALDTFLGRGRAAR